MFGSSGSTFGGFGQQNQQQQQQQQQPQQGGGLFGGGATGGFGSTGFGASSTPAFGAAAQPAQNTGFGGFGGATSTTPAFGSTASATPAFGSAPATGGGLFGSTQPAQPASTGFSFGGGGTSTFGQSNTSTTGTTGGLFGAKPATTGFGGFGQPAQPQQPQQTGGLFGAASTPGFGAAAQPGQGTGTAIAPFAPTTVMEPPAEEGKPPPASQTAHQFQSISCMPQYKNYSFEELRLQDYQANRKGPTAGSTLGGFGASSTPAFGASSNTTGGGLFGSSSATPAFGAASSTPAFGAANTGTTGGGLFGSGTGTSTFGQPATSQPATGGGLFGATSQPAQNGGLFGSTPAASSPFGAPAASTTTPAFGGFGAGAAKPATSTGFSFGTGAATTTPATGGGLFGSAQPATSAPANPFGQPAAPAATGGGLFGSTQPAAGTGSTFSFGQPAAAKPSLFGSTPAAGSAAPAFGATPAAAQPPKPAFSFGTTPAAGGATGGGLFGAAQSAAPAFGATSAAPATGGLFGSTGTSTFGQPAQPAAGTSTFGAGGGLFGAAKPAAPAGGGLFGSAQPAAGGGLFGSTTAQPAQPAGGLFGSTTSAAPALGGSLFGSTTQPALGQQQQQQQPTAYASADDANAYGSNPLFASAGPSPVRVVEEKKKPPIFTAFRGTPVRSSTKITRLRGFGNSSTASPAPGATPLGLSIGSSLGASLAASNGAPGTPGGRGSPLRLVNGIGDDVALSPNAFVSRPSVKKLVIDKKTVGKNFNPSPDKEGAAAQQQQQQQRAKVSFNPEVEVPSRSASLFGSRTPGPAHNGEEETSFAASEGATDANVTLDSPSLARRGPSSSSSTPASKPKHGEYYTIPSLDTLQKLPAAKLRAVPDLVVARVGYGQVAFNSPVDLTTLSSVEDLLGDIILLEDRNATVYPAEFEDVKPPPGEGLNVPATITLEGCYPVDKATRKPIKDANHPMVQKHVKRLRNIQGTTFVDYDAETGKWTFEAEEF